MRSVSRKVEHPAEGGEVAAGTDRHQTDLSKEGSGMSNWCAVHPRYEAKRKPGSICGECWRLYFLKNPEEKPRYQETYQDSDKLRAHLLKP
jgi:hypothetical protein